MVHELVVSTCPKQVQNERMGEKTESGVHPVLRRCMPSSDSSRRHHGHLMRHREPSGVSWGRGSGAFGANMSNTGAKRAFGWITQKVVPIPCLEGVCLLLIHSDVIITVSADIVNHLGRPRVIDQELVVSTCPKQVQNEYMGE